MDLKQRSNYQNNKQAHSDASRSKTLANGLRLLERLSEHDAPAGVRDLSRELDFNPALVQRLINTLAEAGFVEQEPRTRRYRIGPKALRIGRAYIAGHGLVGTANPILRELSESMLLNVYLGVRSGGVCTYLLVLKSPGKLSVNVVPGDQVPVHSTAMGKALLAGLTDEELRHLLEEVAPQRITDATVTDFEQIVFDVRAIREGRAAISDQENIPGIFAVGAPVRDGGGNVIAAISGARAVAEIDAQKRQAICEAVLGAARQISQRMGA